MKLCSNCGAELTSENGYRRKLGAESGRLKNLCRSCGCEAASKWVREHPETAAASRRSWARRNPLKITISSRLYNDDFRARLNSLKSERPCYDCGGMFPPEAKDFDHVTGKKSFGVSEMVGKPWQEVRLEIDKCQLVCACCHRIRTQKRFNLCLKNPVNQ